MISFHLRSTDNASTSYQLSKNYGSPFWQTAEKFNIDNFFTVTYQISFSGDLNLTTPFKSFVAENENKKLIMVKLKTKGIRKPVMKYNFLLLPLISDWRKVKMKQCCWPGSFFCWFPQIFSKTFKRNGNFEIRESYRRSEIFTEVLPYEIIYFLSLIS